MVCLGPRKKEKKGLNPSGTTMTAASGAKTSGSSLKKSSALNTARLRNSKTNSSLASITSMNNNNGTKVAARKSAEALTNGKRGSVISNFSGSGARTSTIGAASKTDKSLRPTSPPTATRASGLVTVGARTAGHTVSGTSRPNSAASSIRNGGSSVGTPGKANGKRYPITEMKEEVKDLKAKNEENLKLIAEQKAELERLKQQLQQQQQMSSDTDIQSEPTDDERLVGQTRDIVVTHNTTPNKPIVQAEELSIVKLKEEQLLAREQEIEKLRSLLEEKERLSDLKQQEEDREYNDGDLDLQMQQPPPPPVPDSLSRSEQQEKSNAELIAEKQRFLEEKEARLEEQKRILEEKKETAMEQVVSELEALKTEKSDTAKQLALRDKELEELKSKMNDISSEEHDKEDKEALLKIEELHKQLEEQRRTHEESLRIHEEALAEKEKLLNEQKRVLEALKESHTDELSNLQSTQSESILALKKKHAQERINLMQQLEEAKKQAIEAAANSQNTSSASDLDEHLERILHEFEQAEHTHAVELKDLEQSHQSQLDTLENNQQNELNNLLKGKTKVKRDSGKWTERFLPTDAVSWPVPSREHFTKLRPTSPAPLVGSKSKTLLKALSNTIIPAKAEPVLTPSDPKKVQIYYSSVSGNAVIKRNQEQIQLLLQAQKIPFSLVDVASSEAARQYAKRCNNNGSTTGRIKEFPQLYVGGEYRGQFEDVVRAIDDGTLSELLHAAAERQLTAEERAAIIKAELNEEIASAVNQQKLTIQATDPLENDTVKGDIPTIKMRAVRPFSETEEDEELFKEIEQELKDGKDLNLDEL